MAFKQLPDPASAATEARDRLRESGLPLGTLLAADETPSTTKSRILDTAITLFAERGFQAGTMRDLAAAVGIKAPAIYNHYASKDLVLAEAMQQILGSFFEFILEGLEDTGHEEWLRTIVYRHIRFQVDYPRHARANDALITAPGLEHSLPKEVFSQITSAQRAYIELIRAAILVLSPEADGVDALIAAFSITATGNRVVSWYDPRGPLDQEEIADRHWALVRRMIGA